MVNHVSVPVKDRLKSFSSVELSEVFGQDDEWDRKKSASCFICMDKESVMRVEVGHEEVQASYQTIFHWKIFHPM